MNYKQVSENELWECCQLDDLRAYNELFDRFAKTLYRQTMAYVHNAMDAEELVMDLMLHLWERRLHLNVNAGINMKAYLIRAMRNRIINHLQKKIPEQISIDQFFEGVLADCSQADDGLIARDMEIIYESLVDKLSPQRQKVFRLSREKNMTYVEIARELNLSVNTVENYMVSALNKLREDTRNYQSLILLLVFLLAK
ncbi:RNA polymerase sigma-70 factor [Sphingobacterium sp.]|uniref:RNA polymerase sigma-70 factor n=1 Tax=Sphingobacterium sp. TaxID=341027 RepID=UPI00258D917A|nr:RNA polymerase sigma-70 factor [Sphingobacterium sp.]WET67037.1 MAG: RNA polymerase sigma-70 factor [Sphingobacterium sp.]